MAYAILGRSVQSLRRFAPAILFAQKFLTTQPKILRILEDQLFVSVSRKMKLGRWIAILCVLLLLAYGASPYFSFWRFSEAVRAGDSAAISSRVDFPAVRASLKKQLVARFAQTTSSHKRWSSLLGPTLIDTIVDAYITPEGIAALLSNPQALKSLQSPQQFRFSTGKGEGSSKVRYAFFTGPRTFLVDREELKLRFHFTGRGWKLTDLDLGLAAPNR